MTIGRMVNDREAAAAVLMTRVVAYAETVGLVPAATEAGVDLDDFDTAYHSLARHGLVRRVPYERTPEGLERISRATLAAIEASPIPDAEWHLIDVLGDRLADLVGISGSSMSRYRSEQRVTPDDVANRLHTLALIVADLSGSYNDYGIRRWFERPRQALGGQAPRDILTGPWDPDSENVTRIRDLAAALVR
jgi:hypothetical protein